MLVNVEGGIRVLLVARREAQQQVAQSIFPPPIHTGETPGHVELAEQRTDVPDACFYVQQLNSELQRVRAPVPGHRLAHVHPARRLKLRYGSRSTNPLQRATGEIENGNTAADRRFRGRILQADEFARAA